MISFPQLNVEGKMNKFNQEIIDKKSRDVQLVLKNSDYIDHYILETLSNFAYRFFENPNKPEIIIDGTYRVCALEKGIKEAIKIRNPQLRLGIGELVKKVSKEQGPTILRELRVRMIGMNPQHKGSCEISSRISFGHPDHHFDAGSFVDRNYILNFEDELHLRNVLAKHLEEVCELFE